MNKPAITLFAAMLFACSSHAQTKAPTTEAFGPFFGKAALHINTGIEIQRLCPTAKLDPDLNAFLRTAMESSALLLAILDEQIAQTKNASQTLAPELVNNHGGCSGSKFKELESVISLLSADLIMRWIKQDF